MANRKPLVVTSGVVQRLQSGDKIAGTDVENVVTAASAFGTDSVLVLSDGVDRGAKSSSIAAADVVTAAAGFATDGRIIRADGTGKGVQFATATLEDNGQCNFRNTAELESPVFGAEQLSSDNWTSTDWTGSFEAGYTHTTGNTTALTNTLAATIGAYYRVTFTVSGRTAGTITVSFGGLSQAGGANGTFTFGPRATTTGALSITPTSTFDGTLSNISIQEITDWSPPSVQVIDSNATFGLQIRTNIETSRNIGIGKNSLGFVLTGVNNTALGQEALRSCTTGIGNFGCGTNTCRDVTTGSQNTGIGADTMPILSTGSSNTGIGGTVLTSLTTGNFNTAAGRNAGNSLTTAEQTVMIGLNAGNNASQLATGTNMIAIGAGTFCTASNTVVLGNSSITATTLRGIVQLGVFSDANRGAAGTAGRVIFNSTDGNLNIDNGTNWILPDGSIT